MTGCPPGELLGQFDALGFATREGGTGLTELRVAQTDRNKRFELAGELGEGDKKLAGLFDCHCQDIGDVLIFVAHLQRFVVVA